MHSFRPWMLIVVMMLSIFTLAVLNTAQASAPALLDPLGRPLLQSASISMVNPPACPNGRCAAGQRLTLRLQFPLSGYDPAEPNVKICIYTPITWNIPPDPISVDQYSEIPGVEYTSSDCDEASLVPNRYVLNTARQANIPAGETVDSLGLSLIIPRTATGDPRIIVRILVHKAGKWPSVLDLDLLNATLVIPIVVSGSPAYVANDADRCGSNSPCYIDSAGDAGNGVGTGLRDAVEAAPPQGTIYVLGTYTIKSETINIDRPVILTGLPTSPGTITYSGPVSGCSGAMLSIMSSTIIRGLTINDGLCNSPSRDLLDINTPITPDPNGTTVIIESNTLTDGKNAIDVHILDGSVTVLYNQIAGNDGAPLNWAATTNNGSLDMTANNIYGNVGNINCGSGSANRTANHNYFGSQVPTAGLGNCTLNPAKRLGAPIALKLGQPGVNAYKLTITDTRPNPADPATSPFGSLLSYKRSGANSQDFELYIVDHGFLNIDSVPPFPESLARSPAPCSNYYDFFLPDGVSTNLDNSTILDLYFKYNRTSECAAAIDNSQICLKRTPTPEVVPVFWYDVAAGPAPTAWASSYQNSSEFNGQSTTCDKTVSELHLAISATGSPNWKEDLNYTAIMAGVPAIHTFKPLAERNNVVNVTWSTNAEPDIKEFQLLSGSSKTALTPIPGSILSRGNAISGSTYNKENIIIYGTPVFYRLKAIRDDGSAFYSEVYGIVPSTPTIMPTPTASLTPTRTTIPPTRTPTLTRVPINVPTRIPTRTLPGSSSTRIPSKTPLVLPTVAGTIWTATPLPFLTGTIGPISTATITAAPSKTFGPEGSPTPTLSPTLPPRLGTGTAVAMLRSLTPDATRRPTRTATILAAHIGGVEQNSPSWLSLLIGLLIGTATVGALASVWWYLRSRV